MREAGVRDLKTHASKILQQVRRRRQRYVITHRGKPVALLAPIEPESSATLESVSGTSAWDELIRLGREIGKGWKSAMSSAELLSEMRR